MDDLPCGVIEVNQNRIIIKINKYVCNISELTVSQIKSNRIDEILSAASKIFLDSYVYPLLVSEGFANEVQLSINSSTGRKIPIVANISMRQNKSSLWTIMVCENRDRLYEELISTRDQLSAYTVELRELNDQVQRENDDLQAFCHSLSHDFIAPINQTQMLIDMALDDLAIKGFKIEDEMQLIDEAKSKLDVIKYLTSGLLDFLSVDSQLDADSIVEISEILASAIDLNNVKNDEKFQYTVGKMPKFAGNAAQLVLIFKNLIGNSIKYNKRYPKIWISSKHDPTSNRELISVRDNGIGMESEYLERIFAPFSRLHAESEFSGSGLGLSIVRKVLMKHNGDISVASTVGVGSTFTVSFPTITLED